MQLHPRVQQLKPSATLAINEKSAELIAAGKPVYRLGFGQSPFPVPEEVVAALRQNAHQKAYLPVLGLYTLREAVATFNQQKLGLNYVAEQVMIGPGSKELIYGLLLALDADLLLPSPSWVSYEPQASLVEKKTTWIPTQIEHNWCLQADDLAEVCQRSKRKKILILNYPNNPTGATYSAAQLAAIAQVARKYELLIVADEIYGELHHQGQHQSMARYYPEGTIISAGLSKWCGAGGWRLGTLTFPNSYTWLLDAMATIASETFTSVSAPIQYAAVTAFAGSPAISQYVEHSRMILKTIGQYVYQQLTNFKLQLATPEGGFYVFPDFVAYHKQLAARRIHSSDELCATLLLETGVALLPGSAFGRPATELNARLSFVDFDGGGVLKFLQADPSAIHATDFMEQYCPRIVASMAALGTWLEEQ